MPVAMTSPDASLRALLREHAIDLILDVGANQGQFARSVLGLGYSGRIVSFEPLPSAHAALQAESQGTPRWEVAERCCLGERAGEVEIHVSENSISSSLLPIRPEHVAISREAHYVAVESVPMRTLDEVAPRYLGESRAPFLKVDVQGYEDRVLRGARETLERVRGIQIELSFVPVYDGQMLFLPLVEWIVGLGFTPVRFLPSFVDPKNGRWLQADGLFFRTP
jgi:FkbM family methyltransferase